MHYAVCTCGIMLYNVGCTLCHYHLWGPSRLFFHVTFVVRHSKKKCQEVFLLGAVIWSSDVKSKDESTFWVWISSWLKYIVDLLIYFYKKRRNLHPNEEKVRIVKPYILRRQLFLTLGCTWWPSGLSWPCWNWPWERGQTVTCSWPLEGSWEGIVACR